MAYDCALHLTYVAKDGEVGFVRFVQLPFAPYKGLSLIFADDEVPDWFAVERVEYYVPDDVFWLFEVRDVIHPHAQYPCPCGPGDGCCALESELEFARELGWEIHEGPRYGFDRLERRPWMHHPEQNFWDRPEDADPDEPETSARPGGKEQRDEER
jgi:hypothetical protein